MKPNLLIFKLLVSGLTWFQSLQFAVFNINNCAKVCHKFPRSRVIHQNKKSSDRLSKRTVARPGTRWPMCSVWDLDLAMCNCCLLRTKASWRRCTEVTGCYYVKHYSISHNAVKEGEAVRTCQASTFLFNWEGVGEWRKLLLGWKLRNSLATESSRFAAHILFSVM